MAKRQKKSKSVGVNEYYTYVPEVNSHEANECACDQWVSFSLHVNTAKFLC